MQYYLFKTNIYKDKAIHLIENLLGHYYKLETIGFDVNKKNSTLTIEGQNLSAIQIRSTLHEFGYKCEQINASH
jgi:hypothetical protein